MGDYLVPCLVVAVFGAAMRARVGLYGALTDGAMEGLRLMGRLAPSLVVLLSVVAMLRASGALEAATRCLAPAFAWAGIPPETVPLMLVRPFSGSAALAVGLELMGRYGVDSRIGLTAAVMLGSTETTFYTISVYFSGVRSTRHAVPAALIADLTGFLAASVSVRLMFPGA